MSPTPDALRLIQASFRFVGVQAIRPRRVSIVAFLALLAAAQVALALRLRGMTAPPAGFGVLLTLGFWVISAPLCRSWVDDDVHLGYGALWLQKPLNVMSLYSARLVALLGWGLLATIAVTATALPVLPFDGTLPQRIGLSLIGLGWIPTILVLLAFTGSAAGARNAGLFAYGMLFGGFALEGVADALPLGGLYSVLRHLFPPARAATDAVGALERGAFAQGFQQLAPMAFYALVCALLGVVLAGRVPGRLGRGA